jgi:8-oxo-dGTP pyrophosphatase MutT (NUDIX family)
MNVLTETKISTCLKSQKSSDNYLQDIPLKKAAVLIPIIKENEQWHLLFIRRTDTVNSHKGQVAFPGGMTEPEDLSPEMTAIRETGEEIGVSIEHIHILGRMEVLPTVSTGYLITPVVGRIEWPIRLSPSPEEVSRVFTIPFRWLADKRHRVERPMAFQDGRLERVLFYKPYDGEVLWGITARITIKLLKVLGEIK